MEEIKVSEMLQADSIEKDNAVMIIQDGVNKKASGSIQTATGTSLSLTSVADTCKVTSNSKNLFDESIVNNLWTFADGTISAWTGACIQKYNCSEGDTFTLKATYSTTDTQNNIIAMAFFDSSNTLIGRTANNTTLEITSTAPANTAYMYAGHYVGKPTTMQLEEGSTATSYNPYNTEVKICGKNLFDKNNYTIYYGYVSVSNAKLISSSDDYTTYMRCKPNTTYTISKSILSNFVVGTATGYTTNIPINNAINGMAYTEVTITSGASDTYLLVTFYNISQGSDAFKELLNSMQIEENSTATTYEKFEGQYLDLTPDETKSAFTYDSLTNILSNGSVTIEYNTQSRLLNNDDVLDIVEPVKEYIDREIDNSKTSYASYSGTVGSLQTITGTTAVTIANMSVNIKTTGKPLFVATSFFARASNASYSALAKVYVDGVEKVGRLNTIISTSDIPYTGMVLLDNISAGNHTIEIKIAGENASSNITLPTWYTRYLNVWEIN